MISCLSNVLKLTESLIPVNNKTMFCRKIMKKSIRIWYFNQHFLRKKKLGNVQIQRIDDVGSRLWMALGQHMFSLFKHMINFPSCLIWWPYEMETFYVLPTFCERNQTVTGVEAWWRMHDSENWVMIEPGNDVSPVWRLAITINVDCIILSISFRPQSVDNVCRWRCARLQ